MIGKTNTQEFRSKLPDVVSKKYFNLKQQASVLKEIGGVPNKEKREIERGIFHDHVIGNILSGSISTFGLYNVMKAIETAPPNAYTRETERRDWSILRVIPKEGLIQLATELWNDSKTTKIFVNKLDFALRSLSKHPELMEDLESIPRTIKFIRAYPSKKITTTVLSGLDGLVRDIDKIGTQKWIETKLPYVTQFQGLKIPNLSGNFKDFE